MKQEASNFISKRAQSFQISGIRKIFALAATSPNAINLSIGQPDFGVSEEVKQKTIDAINRGFSKYTPSAGIEPLREKISQKFLIENNIKVSKEDIIVTPGTSAAVFLSLAVLIDPGDEVIIPDPYFAEYPELVKFLDGVPVFLDTYSDDFQVDPEKLKKLITKKTKIIILNSPSNPTGAVFPKKILEQIAKIAEKYNLIIISDEIYEKFIYGQNQHFSIGSIYPNTITIGGFAKSGGMPGWRLAWAAAPSEILNKMVELHQYTFVCAPSLVQYGVLAAFDSKNTFLTNYQAKRDLIYELLAKKFEIVKPEGAFYIMPKVGNGEEFVNLAIKNNVLIIPGNAFSQKNTHIRISYATSEENLEKGINILLQLKKTAV